MMQRKLRAWIFCLLTWMILGTNQAVQVLRFNQDSCKSLSPVFEDENFSDLLIGPPKPVGTDTAEDNDANSNVVFETPKKSNARNPPFSITINSSQYRRNREYKISILAQEYFDAFMLQARGRPRDDGNISYVGSWVDIPSIAVVVLCGQNPLAAVVDKGRPLRLGNMTFTWKAPDRNRGSIQFQASLVYNDAYVTISSETLSFNAFPMSVAGCGGTLSCFRVCQFTPRCDSDGVAYMVIMNRTEDNQILFRMGGYLKDNRSFFAFGLGQDKRNLRNVDLAVCSRADNSVILRHYLLEDSTSQPFRHRARLRLQSSDIDRETGFVWCQFQRPITPSERFDLDLTQRLHHFYLWGRMDNRSVPIIPFDHRLFKSFYKFNISEVYNEVIFSSGLYEPNQSGSRSWHSSDYLGLLAVVLIALGASGS